MSVDSSEVSLPTAGLEPLLCLLRLSLHPLQRLPQQPQGEDRVFNEGESMSTAHLRTTHLRGHYWYPGAGAVPLPLCRKPGVWSSMITPEVMQVGCADCVEILEFLLTKKLAVLIGLKSKKLLAVPTFGGHPYNQHPDIKPSWSGNR